jgi:hypothetical protein
VEDTPLLSATIWSHEELPINQDFNLPQAAWEANG